MATVSFAGIKSAERMNNKMLSRDDHKFAEKPRPARNIDVVRCLAVFDEAADMVDAYVVQRVRE